MQSQHLEGLALGLNGCSYQSQHQHSSQQCTSELAIFHIIVYSDLESSSVLDR
jgi:hypothetical protein